MGKKYIVLENKDSKYYKHVPYIAKKKFRENNSNIILGETRLKNISILKITD